MQRRDAMKHILVAAAAPILGSCGVDRLFQPEFASSETGSVTLIGAGDLHAALSAVKPRQRTAALVKKVLDADPTAVAFMVGDLTHTGKPEEYASYYAPTWGQFRERTLFCIGNHDTDFTTPSGAPYYAYTKAQPYFAQDIGPHWRAYSLACYAGAVTGASATQQATWLRNDLAAHPDKQYLALFHYPMFSSVCEYHTMLKGHPSDMTWKARVGPWWQILQEAGAEFALSGHAHRYERLRPMLRDGTVSSRGIRQFVCGTAGVRLRDIVPPAHPASEKIVIAHGVVRFDLYPDHYQWTFTDEFGAVRDTGTQLCQRALA